MMSPQVIIGISVEALLVIVTSFCLIQPRKMFESKSDRSKKIFMVLGWALLCITFCWSVVLGSILVLNRITLSV